MSGAIVEYKVETEGENYFVKVGPFTSEADAERFVPRVYGPPEYGETLTKLRRERIATAVLAGLMSSGVKSPEGIEPVVAGARLAIVFADALIAELDK